MQKQSLNTAPVRLSNRQKLLKRTNTYSPNEFVAKIRSAEHAETPPSQLMRHNSEVSLSSAEDGDLALFEAAEQQQQEETLRRRGRRSAIYNSKCGQLRSPDHSPDDSITEDDDGSSIEASRNRRRSSLALNIEVLPRIDALRQRSRQLLRKQNTIADLTQKSLQTYASSEDLRKRASKSILRLIDIRRNRGKESAASVSLQEAMLLLSGSEFRDIYLISFKKKHWTELTDKWPQPELDETERLRREAVWELFKSELIYLADYLMALKHCFLEPLKKLQVDGHLMIVEPDDLFGNLDELCYVSYTFSRDLLSIFLKEAASQQLGTAAGLAKSLKRWMASSRNGDVYHSYCLNYHCAITYLDILRRNEQFCEYERWCQQDSRCHRLQLSDLLVAPMQHCTKMPLLLANIRKYTKDKASEEMLTDYLKRVEHSLQLLEEKLQWLRNFERLQNIQQQLIWPPVSELEPRAFIPEFLRSSLSAQPCEHMIANPKRQLVHEGYLSLLEVNKTVDLYGFLFDDLLLLTRIKKQPKKRGSHQESTSTYSSSPTDGAVFVVHRQPIALDRFSIVDIAAMESSAKYSHQDSSITSDCVVECTSFKPLQSQAFNLRHAFVLVTISRFRQVTGLFTLQAASEQAMMSWLEQLRASQDRFQEKLKLKLALVAAGGDDGSELCTSTHSKLISKMRRLKQARQAAAADAQESRSRPQCPTCLGVAAASPTSANSADASPLPSLNLPPPPLEVQTVQPDATVDNEPETASVAAADLIESIV